MNASQTFGLAAGLIAVVAYGFYFRQMLKSQSTPNPSSWGIWLLAGAINTFTYFSVSGQNVQQSLIVAAVLFSTAAIFVYALFKGSFTKVSSVEVFVFALAVTIGIFWRATSNDRVSNILLQGIYLISYIPTTLGILRGMSRENPTSWIVILVAYVFSTLSVTFGPHADWVVFLNPLVNGLLGTGVVVVSILYKNSRRVSR